MVAKVLPTTHAMRIVRGILLKGNGGMEIVPERGRSRCRLGHHRDRRLFYRETLD